MKGLNVVAAALAVIIGWSCLSLPAVVVPPHIPKGSPTRAVPPWFVFSPLMATMNFFEGLARKVKPPYVQIFEMAISYWKSEVLYALVKNNIIDAIGLQPMTCERVAKELDLVAHAVCQYMKAGEALGLLNLSRDGTYTLSAAGKLVQSDAPVSLCDFVIFNSEELSRAWRGASAKSIKTGESGSKAALGHELWEYYRLFPDKGAQYDRGLQQVGRGQMGAVLTSWKPPKDDILFCDIGGGIGTASSIFLDHYPEASGLVFDQVHNMDETAAFLSERELTPERCQLVGGDFFQRPWPQQLSSCDVFFMKWILHDWPDEESITIVKNIKDIGKPGAKVVIVEQVMNLGRGLKFDVVDSLANINMLAACPMGAKERSLPEYEAIFAAAGFKHKLNLIPIWDAMSVLEVDA